MLYNKRNKIRQPNNKRNNRFTRKVTQFVGKKKKILVERVALHRVDTVLRKLGRGDGRGKDQRRNDDAFAQNSHYLLDVLILESHRREGQQHSRVDRAVHERPNNIRRADRHAIGRLGPDIEIGQVRQ